MKTIKFSKIKIFYFIFMTFIFIASFPWQGNKGGKFILTAIGGFVIGFPLSISLNSLIYNFDLNYIIYKTPFLHKFNLYFSPYNFYPSIIINIINFFLGYFFWFKILPSFINYYRKLFKFIWKSVEK